MSDLAALWEKSKPAAKAPDGDLAAMWDASAPAEDGPSAFTRNVAQMAPLGFGNQLLAAEGVAKERLGKGAAALLSGKGLGAAAQEVTAPGAVGEYRQKRDALVSGQEAASEADPAGAFAGKAVGILPSMLIPGGSTLRGAMATGAGIGGAEALAESKADLTKGEVGQAALDTVVGGAGGAAGGAAGYGLGKLIGAAGQRAAGGIREAEADAAAQANAAAQKAFRSARGSLGGEAAAALHAVDMAEEIAANASGHYTPAQMAEAAAWLKTPEVAALRQNAAGNVLEAGQNRIPGSLATAQQIFQQAKQGITPQAVEAGAAQRLEDPFKNQVLPRLKNYASRAIPPIVGASIGGVPGAILGFGAGAVMGNPGTAMANMLKSPAVRRMAWQAVQAGAGALGKFGPILQRAASEGGAELAEALHEALLKTDPEYQQKVGALMESGGTQ